MKTITRTMRLAVATAAVLAVTASAAQARPNGLNPTTGLATGVGVQTSVSQPPDRVDRIGAATLVTPSQLPPDRVDQIGTSRQPTPSTPTVIVQTSGESFDWLTAAIAAASVILAVLLAAAALAARGRRRVTLSA
jgi:hypothetical protein